MEALEDFVLSKVDGNILIVSSANWENLQSENDRWLLFLCNDDNPNCPSEKNMLKLSASLVYFL